MHIMVTGATGYVGSNIISKLLHADSSIHIVAALRNKDQLQKLPALIQENPRVSFRYGDLAEETWNMQDIDVLIHCAALLIGNNVSTLFQINVDGTRKVLKEAKKHHLTRVVFLSSQSVYGATRSELLQEEMPAQPASLYATSKLAGELLCLDDEFIDLQTITLRVARIYGTGFLMRTNLLPHYYADMAVKKEALPIFIHTQNSVNYLNISDLSDAACKAAIKEDLPKKLTLNIGNTTAITNLELAAVCQKASEMCKIKKPALKLIEKGSHLSITSGMHIERAKRYLDWSPQITMIDGMCELIQSKSID